MWDGTGPRFKVISTTGYAFEPDGSLSGGRKVGDRPTTEFYVVDTAYNYRVISAWHHRFRRAEAERLAHAHATLLELGDLRPLWRQKKAICLERRMAARGLAL